ADVSKSQQDRLAPARIVKSVDDRLTCRDAIAHYVQGGKVFLKREMHEAEQVRATLGQKSDIFAHATQKRLHFAHEPWWWIVGRFTTVARELPCDQLSHRIFIDQSGRMLAVDFRGERRE